MATPLMGMDLPVPTSTIGPDWAAKLVQALQSIVDAHDHSSGKGARVGVGGLNLQGDLSLNGKSLTTVAGLVLQSAAIPGSPSAGQIRNSGGELYFVDGTGIIVQLTKAGAVNVPTPTNVLIDSGAKAPSATYTSPAWASNAYDIVHMHGKLSPFNGGATWQAYWKFQGPPAATMYSSHYWGSTAAGTTFVAQGNPGSHAEFLEDQINSSVARWVQAEFYPKIGMAWGRVYTAAPTFALQWTEWRGATLDSTPITGIQLDWNGNSLGFDSLTLVGQRF